MPIITPWSALSFLSLGFEIEHIVGLPEHASDLEQLLGQMMFKTRVTLCFAAFSVLLLGACVPAVISYYRPSAPGAQIVGNPIPKTAIFKAEGGVGIRISIEELYSDEIASDATASKERPRSKSVRFGFYNVGEAFRKTPDVDVQWLDGEIVVTWPDGVVDRRLMTWPLDEDGRSKIVDAGQGLPEDILLAPGPVVRLGPSTGYIYSYQSFWLSRSDFETVTVDLPKARINDREIDPPPVVFRWTTRPAMISVNGPGGV